MIKNFFLTVLSLLLIQNFCFAKDTIQFNFPNEGWHKIESPDGIAGKKCYIPYNQTPENYTEVLACDTEKFSLYFREMLRRRQFVAPSQFEAMFVSNAHTREHIEETCEAIALSCTAAKARQE